jgi:hypothetical protein
MPRTAPAAPRYSAVIQDEPTVQFDDTNVVWNLIATGRKMRIGLRDYMYSNAETGTQYVQFDTGMGRAKRRFIVTVAPDDTFSVEVGRLKGRMCEWVSIEVARGTYFDSLGEVVERMFERSVGG